MKMEMENCVYLLRAIRRKSNAHSRTRIWTWKKNSNPEQESQFYTQTIEGQFKQNDKIEKDTKKPEMDLKKI